MIPLALSLSLSLSIILLRILLPPSLSLSRFLPLRANVHLYFLIILARGSQSLFSEDINCCIIWLDLVFVILLFYYLEDKSYFFWLSQEQYSVIPGPILSIGEAG